jgi:hypothetical protein
VAALLTVYTPDEIVEFDVVKFDVQGDDFLIHQIKQKLLPEALKAIFVKYSFSLKVLNSKDRGENVDFLSHWTKIFKFNRPIIFEEDGKTFSLKQVDVFYRNTYDILGKMLCVNNSELNLTKEINGNIAFSTVVSYGAMYCHDPVVMTFIRIILSCIPIEHFKFVEDRAKGLSFRMGQDYDKLVGTTFIPTPGFFWRIQTGISGLPDFSDSYVWELTPPFIGNLTQGIEKYRKVFCQRLFLASREQSIKLRFLDFHDKDAWKQNKLVQFTVSS